MQKKFTDAVIIKALECCKDGACYTKECPLIDIGEDSVIRCVSKLCELCLDLINRQKAEIEKLKERKKLYLDRWQESLDFAKEDRAEAIREFAEIIVSEFPEIEFYTNKLAKEMTDGD